MFALEYIFLCIRFNTLVINMVTKIKSQYCIPSMTILSEVYLSQKEDQSLYFYYYLGGMAMSKHTYQVWQVKTVFFKFVKDKMNATHLHAIRECVIDFP